MVNLLIISSVIHKKNSQGSIGGYGPYVNEMNLWLKYADNVTIVAPINNNEFDKIDISFIDKSIDFKHVPAFSLTSLSEIIKSLFVVPYVFLKLIFILRNSNHIHLRCPGNMGLIGLIVQLFFPHKMKTAKYAGNWDWNSKQPWSYRLQQRILRNTFFTRNMQVLVYGEWPDRTRNILPFFTASYLESEKKTLSKPDIKSEVRLVFIGALSPNKSPLSSLQVLKLLSVQGISARLTYCGEGPEREILEQKIHDWNLRDKVELLGNVSAEIVKNVLQQAHFLVFISRSEGWPKAVAEAMWWKCIPITTAVSCVPQMLGDGARGFLVENNPETIAKIILQMLMDPQQMNKIQIEAQTWAWGYTLERFEKEIKTLLIQ